MIPSAFWVFFRGVRVWNAESHRFPTNILTPSYLHFNWGFFIFFSAVPTKIGTPPKTKMPHKNIWICFFFLSFNPVFLAHSFGCKTGVGVSYFLTTNTLCAERCPQGEIRWVGDLSTSDFCCCYVWPRMAERSGWKGCGGCGRHMQMVANTTGSSKGASKMDRRMASNNYIDCF